MSVLNRLKSLFTPRPTTENTAFLGEIEAANVPAMVGGDQVRRTAMDQRMAEENAVLGENDEPDFNGRR